jgi:hypothetical protein
MDFSNVTRFMDQQLKALKEIEDLLAHNEKQVQTHNIRPEDIEALKDYVATMKLAASTAKKLAEHYKLGSAKPVATKTADEKQDSASEPAADTADGTAEEVEKPEKPKRRRGSVKQETPQEEPAAGQPGEEAQEKAAWEEFDFLS